MAPGGLKLRPASARDAARIAEILGDALRSLPWMPIIHTRAEDLRFISDVVLPGQIVVVAETGGTVAGFIAVDGDWIRQLYLDPAYTGRGIGSALLADRLKHLPVAQLWCFQANEGARRFYERHGFTAEQFTDGEKNEEGLPDIRYVRRR